MVDTLDEALQETKAQPLGDTLLDTEVKTPTTTLVHMLAKAKPRHFPTHWTM